MMKSTLDIAFGNDPSNWPDDVPNLRYIGVGPDPEQIIRDVPETRKLIELA